MIRLNGLSVFGHGTCTLVTFCKSSGIRLVCLGAMWTTMINAIPLFTSTSLKKDRSACSPPADAPMPITGKRLS